MAAPGSLIHRLETSRPGRAWKHYGQARGGVLAGGVAFAAFFSLFPALAVGFTVFGLVLGRGGDLQERVVQAVNSGVGTPIIITHPGGAGIVQLSALTNSRQLGLIGLVGLLLTGFGWLDSLREGVRAMFDQPPFEGNLFRTKLRDALVLATLGVVLLTSAVGGLIISTAAGTVLGWVGLDGSLTGKLLLGAASTMLLLVVDVTVFLVIFRLLAGVHVPRHDLWDAALFGAIGLGVLKLFGGLLLHTASSRFLPAEALVIGLLGVLVWLNLVSRLTLIAASWGATMAMDRGHLVPAGGREPASEPRAMNGRSVDSDRLSKDRLSKDRLGKQRLSNGGKPASVPFTPVVSQRGADRMSVAAGAVLGAAGLVAARTARVAVRTLVAAVRRSDQP
jgi:membrane protein